jgi:hypothetical protein
VTFDLEHICLTDKPGRRNADQITLLTRTRRGTNTWQRRKSRHVRGQAGRALTFYNAIGCKLLLRATIVGPT